MLLNSDVEVTPNWLEPMVTLLDSDSHIAACQPKILSYHNKDSFEYAGAAGGFIDQYGYPFCRGRIFDTLEKDQAVTLRDRNTGKQERVKISELKDKLKSLLK